MAETPKAWSVRQIVRRNTTPNHHVTMRRPNLTSNSAMTHDDATEQRLIDMEIKLGFTEDLVDHLNQTVIRQQQQIDALVREISALRHQIPEGNSGTFRSLRDELPPHY
jgi:SlyX protein